MVTRDEIADFSVKIEELVYMKDISYIEAITLYCEETGFEIELVPKLLSSTLKSKIQSEAEALHCLPSSNTAKLPLVETDE